SVILGDGTGSFGPPLNLFVTGGGCLRICTSDFNDDGNTDLAFANGTLNSVSVMLGDGGGNFQIDTTIPVTGSNYSIIADDLNGDGNIDIATPLGNEFSLIFGDGNGGFSAPVNHPYPGYYMTSGDFNNDGMKDLAVSNQIPDCVQILIGIGNGNFGFPMSYPVGGSPYGITCSDFNADGKTDIAIAGGDNNLVSVLMNAGNGSFQQALSFPTDTNHTVSITCADFNNDGMPDIATGSHHISISVLLNCDAVGISMAVSTFTVAAYPNPTSGKLIISTSFASGELRIYDANGKHVLSTAIKSEDTQLDLNGYRSGCYLLQLENEGIYYSKIISVE
ncbi:MAG TPA: FG-GAP-like repeat-containing protein, partial [Bacteroidia bacterium]|nr:FG-GAP-like repeat-containing protein [Bacteroidia bacterium]